MDPSSKALESDDLLVVLRLMPGELICALIKALGPSRRSRLAHAAKTSAFGGENLEDLLKKIDIGIRRLAAHKMAEAFRLLPNYRETLRRLCADGGVELAPEDTAAEMERKLLVRTYEQRDNKQGPQREAGSVWNAAGQLFLEILAIARKMPIARRVMERAGRNQKAATIAAVMIAVATLAAVGNRLAGPAYTRLEDCIRIIAVFRQAKLFELIAEEAS